MRNFTVTRLGGVPIRIDLSLVVVLPVLAWLLGSASTLARYAPIVDRFVPSEVVAASLTGGQTPLLVGALAVLATLASVAIHELGHAVVGRRHGVETESITLWLLGGIATVSSMPRDPRTEFVIAAGGPTANLLTATACYGLAVVLGQGPPVAVFLLGWLVLANLALVGFNLLPAFPMDGGRILRSLLAGPTSYGRATRVTARLGVLFAVGFAVLGIHVRNPVLVLLALFVYSAATTESRIVAVVDLLEGLAVGDVLPQTSTTVPSDTSLDELLARMSRDGRTEYAVTDGHAVMGAVTLDQLEALPTHTRDSATVSDVMTTALPELAPTADAFDGLTAIDDAGTAAAFLVEDGVRRDVVSRNDFGVALQWQYGDAEQPRGATDQPLPVTEAL